MTISRLQYITNGQTAEEILKEVDSVLDAGVDWVQLRIKDPQLDFLSIAHQVKELCEDKATLIINDKVDVTIAVNADGVHLGKDDMALTDARKLLGDKIIGATANTLEDCTKAQNSGADYIGLGPFRFTNTKKKLSPVLGIEGYQQIVPKDVSKSQISVPVVAIGGIQLEDIRVIRENSGVHGIAVSGMIEKAINKRELINDTKLELI